MASFGDSDGEDITYQDEDCDYDIDDNEEEELEDFDMGEEEAVVDTSQQKVLEESALLAKIEDLVQQANNVVNTSTVNCRMMLFQFGWKVDVLVERFCEGRGVEELLKDAKVTPSTGQPLPFGAGECSVCFEEAEKVAEFTCKIKICTDCFDSYLSGQILENGTPFITCPGYKCTQLIDDEVVSSYCTDKAILKRVILNSYVLANNRMKWCPGTDCSRVIEADFTPTEFRTKTAQCTCGKAFCFNCYGERHEPVNCHLLKIWHSKTAEDLETLKWMDKNTKTCPKCRGQIEKNGGCNHMTCRQIGCGHEFCWICFGNWKNHNGCSKYNDESEKRSKDSGTLQRLCFYNNLYQSHKRSIEFNEQLYDKVKLMQHTIASHSGIALFEMEFLTKAVNSLLTCRTTLMHTYPFAFYLVNSPQKSIFEENQVDLEKAVEALNGYLERGDLEAEEFGAVKRHMNDLMSYVEQRRHALLAHVEQGEQNNFWSLLSDFLCNFNVSPQINDLVLIVKISIQHRAIKNVGILEFNSSNA